MWTGTQYAEFGGGGKASEIENDSSVLGSNVKEALEKASENIGNTNLKVPPGTIRELDVTGAKLQFKGLLNKKNDPTFNLRAKFNKEGEMAYTDDADTNVMIPDTLTINNNMVNGSITVHHIYPNIPELSQNLKDLQAFMATISNLQFTRVPASSWNVGTHDNSDNTESITDSTVKLRLSNTSFLNLSGTQTGISAISSIILPKNKNWIFKFSADLADMVHIRTFFGVSQNNNTGLISELTAFIGQLSNGNMHVMGDGINGVKSYYPTPVRCIISKVGSIINITLTGGNGQRQSLNFNADENIGNYHPCLFLKKYGADNFPIIMNNPEYWVQP